MPGTGEGVARLVDVGATGVSVSDHLFATEGGRSRSEYARPGCDPLTTRAAVAGLTDRLELQTVVMNSAWLHPALLLRGFNQLAVMVGGERVTAGLGAGWSTEEFEALGMTLPRFRPRMERLAEVLALARQLTDGVPVTFEGSHVIASALPLSPRPVQPPRLLVGGGSDRVLEMAGRYVDVLDLHGDPRHGRIAGATMAEPVAAAKAAASSPAAISLWSLLPQEPFGLPRVAWIGLAVLLYVSLSMIWDGWHEVQPMVGGGKEI